MKKILIALETGEAEQQRFLSLAEEAGVPCEFVFTTPGEATPDQVAEACFIVGNVPPRMIAASENLDVLQLFSPACPGNRPPLRIKARIRRTASMSGWKPR